MLNDNPADGGQAPVPEYAIMAGHLVEAVGECTCGLTEFGHLPGCGYEPVITLAELAYLLQHHREDWCVFFGGSNPDNANSAEMRDDEADARAHLKYLGGGEDSGIARRYIHNGPWTVIKEGGHVG